MEITGYKKTDIYTLIYPYHYPFFNKMLSVIESHGTDVSLMSLYSSAKFLNKDPFFFLHNGISWIVTDVIPSTEFLQINDYMNHFLVWEENYKMEGSKEIIELAVSSILEDFNITEAQLYITVTSSLERQDTIVSIDEDSLDDLKVTEYQTLRKYFLGEMNKLLELYKYDSLEIYTNFSSERIRININRIR